MKTDSKQMIVRSDFDINNFKLKNVIDPTNPQDAATKAYVDALGAGISWKNPVKRASHVNLALTGVINVDGVNSSTGERILAKNQTLPAENGIYIANDAGAWARSIDANSASELASASVFVEGGMLNADSAYVQTLAVTTLGTDPVAFVKFAIMTTDSVPTQFDKELIPAAGVGNFQTTGLSISSTPAGNGHVAVLLNGLQQVLGDGVVTKDCYFSNDAGVTAQSISNIESPTSILYWNGAVAGFDLAATDRIDFNYNV